MTGKPWPARLSPEALAALDCPSTAGRWSVTSWTSPAATPWAFPPFDSRDPEGEDVRSASVGQLTAVYWINRPAGRLYVLDLVWLG